MPDKKKKTNMWRDFAGYYLRVLGGYLKVFEGRFVEGNVKVLHG